MNQNSWIKFNCFQVFLSLVLSLPSRVIFYWLARRRTPTLTLTTSQRMMLNVSPSCVSQSSAPSLVLSKQLSMSTFLILMRGGRTSSTNKMFQMSNVVAANVPCLNGLSAFLHFSVYYSGFSGRLGPNTKVIIDIIIFTFSLSVFLVYLRLWTMILIGTAFLCNVIVLGCVGCSISIIIILGAISIFVPNG